MMNNRKILNRNLLELVHAFDKKYSGCVLEGGSRSGKTWSVIDFLIWICTIVEKHGGAKIIITRETFNSFKTTLYDDFNRRMKYYPAIVSPFIGKQNVSQFEMNGNIIHLMGADDPDKFDGVGCDYFWMNEALDQPHEVFDQLEQRCKKFWMIDFNPKALTHWVYQSTDYREDIHKFHSTQLMNPYISKAEKRKILSYEPTPENTLAGTADEYRWKVYGLGLRSQREGAIFKNWEIGKFDETLPYGYGQDFGTRDPDAFIKVAIDRTKMIIYVKELIYQNSLSTNELADLMWKHYEEEKMIVADTSAARTIKDLRKRGFNIVDFVKTPVVDGIKAMQDYKIIVAPNSPNIQQELVDYVWMDKKAEMPIDKNNHAMDAIRYYFTKVVKAEPVFKGHTIMKR